MPSTPSSTDPPPSELPAGDASPRRLSRGAIAGLIIVCIAIPAVLLVLISRSQSSKSSGGSTSSTVVVPSPQKAKIGSVAPDFTLPTLDGKTVKLSDLRGKPVVLSFFASWCHPCEEDMPILQKVHETESDKVSVIGVNFRDFKTDTRDFVNRLHTTFPALVEDAVENPVGAAYDVRAMPDTLFIDANGVVRDRVYGQTDQKDLQASIDKLLGR